MHDQAHRSVAGSIRIRNVSATNSFAAARPRLSARLKKAGERPFWLRPPRRYDKLAAECLVIIDLPSIRSGCALTSPRLHQQKQVGIAGLLARSSDHGVGLSAVVGLMVEEMRDQERARRAQLLLRRLAEPDQV